MMTTTVVQARQKGVRGYKSIGRPGRFGNWYKVGDENPLVGGPMNLAQVLICYEQHLRYQLEESESFRVAFLALRGQTLGCPCPGAACDPKDGERCHGHVIVRVLEEVGEGEFSNAV